MTVLIRVDADPRIGSGHFMRMIALGQLLRDDGRDVHVAAAARNELCDAYLADERLPTHAMPEGAATVDDAAALTAVAGRIGATWLVLDGARFTEEYQRAVRTAGRRVLSVDDFGRGHFVSDVVLNQNYGAEHLVYSTEPYTVRLLGPRYVMLRREFRTAIPAPRTPGERPLRVLITLGGTRQPGLLARVAAAALEGAAGAAQVRLVVGAFQSIDADLADICRRAGPLLEIVRNTRQMAAAMQWAHAAVTAAGSTMWELCHMRVPFLGLPLDEDHDAVLTQLAADGVCARLPLALLRDPRPAPLVTAVQAFLADEASRAATAARASRIVDPRGTGREIATALDA